jgi:uncharacterized phage infection (PIP) family protein YhgE
MLKKLLFLPTLLALFVVLPACSQPSRAVNSQATIDAAVAATIEAKNSMQAAIDQAVQATLSAQPTPDYATLSEEELAALIDQAVSEALAASAGAATATVSSTSDGTVTSEEVTYTYSYVYDAYYYAAYADELIAAYYEYYGQYAEAALTELQQIESELSSISDSMEEIAGILEQGAEAATAAVDQLNAAVAEAQGRASEVQAKAEGWQEQVKAELEQRQQEILNLAPTEVAEDKIGALNQAHDFLAAFKTALGDGKFSPDELHNIGQLSANVRASFEKLGGRGGEFGGFQASIETLTRQAARGDWGGARREVSNLERSLPSRPSRPSRP